MLTLTGCNAHRMGLWHMIAISSSANNINRDHIKQLPFSEKSNLQYLGFQNPSFSLFNCGRNRPELFYRTVNDSPRVNYISQLIIVGLEYRIRINVKNHYDCYSNPINCILKMVLIIISSLNYWKHWPLYTWVLIWRKDFKDTQWNL
jgi:hypothetical protein